MTEAIFFSFKPTLFAGRFFFWFGPLDVDLMRKWYCDEYGLIDKNDKIGGLSKYHFSKDGDPDRSVGSMLYGGMCSTPDPGHPIIYMAAAPNTSVNIGSLAHEIHHAVQRWTSWLGIYTSEESEEVFAYAEGALVEAVIDRIWNGTTTLGMSEDSRNMTLAGKEDAKIAKKATKRRSRKRP